MYCKTTCRIFPWCFTVLSLFVSLNAHSHGGVYLEDDLCLIRIAYVRAHFKLYLPRSRQHEEFCEELPESGESVFVFEYIDQDLSTIPFDFRIIRNVTGRPRYANEEDVARIGNLKDVTEYYKPARVERDVFTAIHNFAQPGAYIGIITAKRPDTGEVHTTVFPFQVGFAGFGYWPLLIVFIVLYLTFLACSYGWIPNQSISGKLFKSETPGNNKVQE